MIQKFILFICFFILYCNGLQAQAIPYLERPVTINFSNAPIADVFKSLSRQTGVVFTYSSFNDQEKISIIVNQKPLRIVLNQTLSGSRSIYKIKDKYIIIKPAEPAISQTYVVLSGYVYNATDSSRIDRASIYIESSKRSSLTNEYGYFILSNIDASSAIKLSVAKQNYDDAVLTVNTTKDTLLAIYLHPKSVTKSNIDTIAASTIQKDTLENISINNSSSDQSDFLEQLRSNLNDFNSNFKNITDTLFSNFAVTLVPYVSTNRLLSVNTENRVSLNLLVGYSKGVKIAEVGGLMNIDDGSVKYFQMAGIGNIVSKNVSGMQVAGILNINNERTNGFQIAGIYNETYVMNGFQVAGIVNRSTGHVRGMQISGVVNRTDTASGFQLSGLMNNSDYARGIQIAPFNFARKLKGVQLGVFNFSDTCKGIPIGFLSFVKHGYHKVELSADELHFTTFSFGTGANAFHNIFLGGYNFSEPGIYTYGYGIGSALKLSRKWSFTFDVTAQQIQSADYSEISVNMLNRFYAGVEFTLFSGMRICLGPTYNVLASDINSNHYYQIENILPADLLYDQTHGEINIKTWVGLKASLKLF